MWDWMKRSNNTDTQLLKQNHQLQKLLSDQLKASGEREAKLIGCLDRVVMSKFDAPLMAKPQEQPGNIAFPDMSDVLSIEEDKDFIDRMEKLTSE